MLMRKILFACLVLALWAPMPAKTQTQPGVDAPRRAAPAVKVRPKLIAVVFSRNGCGPCRILGPKLKAVRSELDNAPIVFVQFSGPGFGREKEEARAKALGLWQVYQDNVEKMGSVVLVNLRTREVIESIEYLYTEDDVRDAFNEALISARS